MHGLATRKAAELTNKLASLSQELEHWQHESADKGRLEKHHTQVRAVTCELSVPIGELHVRLDALGGGATLAEAAEIEGMILDLHRIWDVFRGKLVLRYVKHFEDYLIGADELAYRCYEPAERRGAAREPPLVFFGDDLSPLTQLRGSELTLAGQSEPLQGPLRSLPVPLIGLPWFQVEHLPDGPIIAHEVGHDVEADLALGPAADAAVDAALTSAGAADDHRRGWKTWREEVFADIFGTVALGPAYTSSLIDFLAGDPRAIAGQWQADPKWRPHPPSPLRIVLSVATLEQMANGAYTDDAAALRKRWFDAYPEHAMTAFEEDVPTVAAAVVAGPYAKLGPGPLTGLVEFAPEAHERAKCDAREVSSGYGARSTDARELVAAARLAFDAAPDDFRSAGVSRRILRSIRESQTVGTRTGTASPVSDDVREARYVAAGQRLNDYLKERRVQAQHD